jgi:hypothetical protein
MIMNIQLEKARIIEKLQQVNDADLILAFKSLLEYGFKKQNEAPEISIPEWHKNIVRKRLKHAQEHPETLLTWDDIMKEVER